MLKKVYCYTPFHMCRSNLVDLAGVEAWLASQPAGSVRLVDDPGQADVIVVTTCAFDQDHQEMSEKEIVRLRRMFPNARIVVGGCLPEIDPDSLDREGPDATFSPRRPEALAAALGLAEAAGRWQGRSCGSFDVERSPGFRVQAAAWRAVEASRRLLAGLGFASAGLDALSAIGFHYSRATLFVRATDGCLGRCTYCAIRKARGTLRGLQNAML